ncbi:MAG TPA: vitamin K epoxide reductase family protein [bacterium]
MRHQRAALLAAVLSLIGLGVSAYLEYLHLGLLRGELLGGAACGVGDTLNCHAVTASRWSSLFGVPLALWGAMGYVLTFALALLARQGGEWPERALAALAALSIGFLALDAYLLFLMAFVIRVYCLYCMATYAVNLLLLITAWSALRCGPGELFRRGLAAFGALVPGEGRPAAWLFWGVVTMGAIGMGSVHGATTFVSRGTLKSLRPQMEEFIKRAERINIDIAGDPVKGAAAGRLQLIEFSDFLCPVCSRAAHINTIILASRRDDAQLAFKHFPLDSACNPAVDHNVHPGACRIAEAAECAHEQGKFWSFHDRVFESAPYRIQRLESDLESLGLDLNRFRECVASGEGRRAVERDIAEGARLRLSSTPTYFVNGIQIRGVITPSYFQEFASALLHEAP